MLGVTIVLILSSVVFATENDTIQVIPTRGPGHLFRIGGHVFNAARKLRADVDGRILTAKFLERRRANEILQPIQYAFSYANYLHPLQQINHMGRDFESKAMVLLMAHDAQHCRMFQTCTFEKCPKELGTQWWIWNVFTRQWEMSDSKNSLWFYQWKCILPEDRHIRKLFVGNGYADSNFIAHWPGNFDSVESNDWETFPLETHPFAEDDIPVPPFYDLPSTNSPQAQSSRCVQHFTCDSGYDPFDNKTSELRINDHCVSGSLCSTPHFEPLICVGGALFVAVVSCDAPSTAEFNKLSQDTKQALSSLTDATEGLAKKTTELYANQDLQQHFIETSVARLAASIDEENAQLHNVANVVNSLKNKVDVNGKNILSVQHDLWMTKRRQNALEHFIEGRRWTDNAHQTLRSALAQLGLPWNDGKVNMTHLTLFNASIPELNIKTTHLVEWAAKRNLTLGSSARKIDVESSIQSVRDRLNDWQGVLEGDKSTTTILIYVWCGILTFCVVILFLICVKILCKVWFL